MKAFGYLFLIILFIAYVSWNVQYCASKKLVDMTGWDAQVCLRH